jgi:hypothetical protein
MSKPREWWADTLNNCLAGSPPAYPAKHIVHVIEASALAEAREEIERTRKKHVAETAAALKFADSFRDQLAAEKAKSQKLVDACKTILNQPFNGDWDSQAVFVCKALAEYEARPQPDLNETP